MGFLERLTGWLRPGRAAGHSKHPLAKTQRKPKAESSSGLGSRPSGRSGTGHAVSGGGRKQLVMGVDVGTSLSKVVVSMQRQRVAVSFNAPGGEDNPYLLPTAVTVMPSGECRLGVHGGASECYYDIKKPLIDGNTDESVRLPLTAFMALLFQHVQEQTWRQARPLSGRLDWLVNLGVPTESYGGGSEGARGLVDAYRHSAEVAWGLAEEMRSTGTDSPLTLDRCRQALQGEIENGSDRIGVFPELVPQVASYAKSKQRQEGVHVLVDVGGGTLDVTVFQVLSSNVDNEKIPVWARTVQPLGTRYLVERITGRRMNGDESGSNHVLSPFRHLPSEAEIAAVFGILPEAFKANRDQFRSCVVRAVGETIREAGKTFKLQWPGRMFLSGGGAFTPLYKGVASEFESKEWKFGVRHIPLPRPNDLEAPAIADAHWHRLAVAYGLSFDPFDIGGITPPGEIEPVPPRYWEPIPTRWIGNW